MLYRVTGSPSIERAIEDKTVIDALDSAAHRHSSRPALSRRSGTGQWSTSTWADVRGDILALAAAFIALGLKPQETVAIMAPNCPEHILADQGAVHAGGLPVSVYATSAVEQVEYIARHAQARIAVLYGEAELARWASAIERLPSLRHVVVVDSAACPPDARFLSYAELVKRGRAVLAEEPELVFARWHSVKPTDPVALVYTSGTTGVPKGVLLSHRNVLYKAESWRRATGITAHPVSVSYLPYAHVAERVNGLYVPIHLAGHVYFCEQLGQFPDILAEVRPHSLTAVPRIWEKLHDRLTRRMADTPDVLSAVEQLRLIGLDRACWCASTAAPASAAVADFFAARGIRLTSVYGMTETTGGITVNRPGRFRAGTVGQVIEGCAARVADDGELLVQGPTLTSGYLHDPAATAELFDADGWAHTGDLAEIDDDGFIRIIGRKKELIVTAGGENIAPALIENLLCEQPAITAAMACGDGRRYVTALVTVDNSLAMRVADPNALVSEAVAAANERLARVQQIKAWRIVPGQWSVETGELTPTFKLRRHVLAERYADLIESMYQAAELVR